MELMEILNNSAAYPDETKFNLGGQDVTLGELRGTSAFKGFTKYSQERASEKKDLETRLQSESYEKNRLTSELTNMITQRNSIPGDPQIDELDVFRKDQTFGPLMKLFDGQKSKMEDLERKTQEYERNSWFNTHVSVIKEIQSKDEDFREPKKVDELLQYAKNNGLSNLSLAYRELTRERDIKRALEDGQKKGMEEGRKKTITEMAVVPSGARRFISPRAEGPSSFDEAEDAALKDSEILEIIQGV